jgi:hypothetical protein
VVVGGLSERVVAEDPVDDHRTTFEEDSRFVHQSSSFYPSQAVNPSIRLANELALVL